VPLFTSGDLGLAMNGLKNLVLFTSLVNTV